MSALRSVAPQPRPRQPDDAMLFEAAARHNFPAFLTPIALSTPANATPFVVGRARFRALARGWPGRGHLIDALEETVAAAGGCGAEVLALLIGGSFTDLDNPAPRDIDAIAFYRQADGAGAIDAAGLAELQRRGRTAGADVRFIPLDGSPIVLIRSISYFTRLYSERRSGPGSAEQPARGLILIDCAEDPDRGAEGRDGAERVNPK